MARIASLPQLWEKDERPTTKTMAAELKTPRAPPIPAERRHVAEGLRIIHYSIDETG